MPGRRRIREGLKKALTLFTTAFVLISSFPVDIHAASLQVSWNPNTEPDLRGYKIYYGTSSGDYDLPIDVGNITGYTLTDLQKGATYYVALTAYDTSLNESAFSQEVSATLPPNRPPHPPGQPSPLDGATEEPLTLNLTWTGGDPDPEDIVIYDVYFGTGTSLPLVSQGQADTAHSPGTLRPATTYFWRIVSRDDQGMETDGPVWSFTTLDNSVLFPTASLLLNQTSFREEDLLSLDIHLTSPDDVPPAGGYPIELKLWLRTPLDPPYDWISLIDIAGSENQITLPPGFEQIVSVIHTPVPPSLLPGSYEFGIRLRNPVTNEEFSVDIQPFSVVGPLN